jgi:hypothetical protein
MTCAHALGLIDAGPLVLSRAEEREAAARHADVCPTCRPARTLAAMLDAGVSAWPSIELPRDFSPTVMARIEALDRRRAEMAAVADSSERRTREHQWSPIAMATGALAAGVAVSTMADGQAASFAATERLGHIATNAIASPANLGGLLAMFASLVLYAAGLFAPLTSGRAGHREL